MSIAYVKGSTKAFTTGLVSALLLVAAMSEMRHLVRVFSISSNILDPNTHAVQSQDAILYIFLGLFVALIFYLIWLAKIVNKAYQNK
jgi:hypothetical protein